MKKLYSLLVFVFACVILQAQTVEMGGDIIKIDGKEILKFQKNKYGSFSIFNQEGDELLMYVLHNNETPSYGQDDYYTLNFLTERKKVEAIPATQTTGMFGINAKKTAEKVLSWLLREKVLNSDGTINGERVDVFVQKYHENIQNRTIRF